MSKRKVSSNDAMMTTTTAAVSSRTTSQQDDAMEALDAMSQDDNNDDKSAAAASIAVPLFIAQPVTGLTVWDHVLLSAMQQRDAAISAADLRSRAEKKLSKQLVKQHEDLRRDLEQHRAAKDAALSRIGKAMSRAVDKCWGRSKRGYEALCAAQVDMEKQRVAEKRQEKFLQETRTLTDFLVKSLNSLMDEFASKEIEGDAAAPAGANTSDAHNDDDPFKTNNNNNGDKPKVRSESFETKLTLLNTLNGRRNLRPYQRDGLKFLLNVFNNGLNCILADEPGLGKTIATLSLFAYFAEHKADWGPHLVVVPASILANWQLECMRWTPGFKVIAYHGSAKEREKLRKGWTAENAFNICIASYTTVLADRNVFKRRAWGFLVLDEAHQIKNTQSQAWNVLYELNCEHRLLLTGTPLQTSEMELWSLLRFIIPPHVAIRAAQRYLGKKNQNSSKNNNNNTGVDSGNCDQQQKDDENVEREEDEEEENEGGERSGLAAAFQNVDDFQRWFSDPLMAMVSGQTKVDAEVITRLQTLLRPFFFRREKKQVEKDLPSKREIVVMCPLSRRQRALYQDFLALADTRNTLERGQYRDVVRILLSLRKVCDHPDLFAERPVAAPLVLDPERDRLIVNVPRVVFLCDLAYFSAKQQTPWWNSNNNNNNNSLPKSNQEIVQVGRFSSITCRNNSSKKTSSDPDDASEDWSPSGAWTAFTSDHWSLVRRAAAVSASRCSFLCHVEDLCLSAPTEEVRGDKKRGGSKSVNNDSAAMVKKQQQKKVRVASSKTTMTADGAAAAAASTHRFSALSLEETLRAHLTAHAKTQQDEVMQFFAQTGIESAVQKQRQVRESNKKNNNNNNSSGDLVLHPSLIEDHAERVQRVVEANTARSKTLQRSSGFVVPVWLCDIDVQRCILGDEDGLLRRCFCPTAADHLAACSDLLAHIVFVVPKAWTRLPMLSCALPLRPVRCTADWATEGTVIITSKLQRSSSSFSSSSSSRGKPVALCDPHDVAHHTMLLLRTESAMLQRDKELKRNPKQNILLYQQQQHKNLIRSFEPGWSTLAHYFHFPDRRWVLQDCGKFFVLFPLFKRLKAQGHRVLIFTQFTHMLGILERFLAFMGLVYLRLDSTLKPDERQFRVERFNRDDRIFAMILTTRSGGVGLNLIGANTVVFISSDWNPSIDAQAQDRVHRIGQTRDVTVYRLISEHTVEARILKKARQRQMLNNLIIRSGKFNENLDEWQKRSAGATFDSSAIRSFFRDDEDSADADDLGFNFGEDGAPPINDETDDQNNNNYQNSGSGGAVVGCGDAEWLQATRDVEDEEDRAAGAAAVEEQRNQERGDMLEHSTLMDMVRDAKDSDEAEKILFRTQFGSCGVDATSWPPQLHKEPGTNHRLTSAVKNATSSTVEAWGAMALPFFGRGTATFLKNKATASVANRRGKRAAPI